MLDAAHPQRRRSRLRLFLSPGRARVAAMINPRLTDAAGRPIGLLGFFESVDDEAAARQVLHAGAAWLRAQGASIVRGPVNYTTWNDYRLTLDATEPGWFVGEPYHPPYYPRLWTSAAFTIATRYGSYWLGDVRRSSRASRRRWRAASRRPRHPAVRLRGSAGALPARDGRLRRRLPVLADRARRVPAMNADRASGPHDTSFVVVAVIRCRASTPTSPTYRRAAGYQDRRGRAGSARHRTTCSDVGGAGALTTRGATRAIGGLMHAEGDPSNMGWCRPEMMFKQYGLFELPS